MKPIHIRRLKKLAKHLLEGKLGHKKFWFGGWNVNQRKHQITRNGCGYAGCAIGECPRVFPSNWKWNDGYPNLRSTPKDQFDPLNEAMVFFSLNRAEARHLFVPVQQSTGLYGGEELRDDATRFQVAQNIEEFLKRKAAK